jgi:hypothetical protein
MPELDNASVATLASVMLTVAAAPGEADISNVPALVHPDSPFLFPFGIFNRRAQAHKSVLPRHSPQLGLTLAFLSF